MYILKIITLIIFSSFIIWTFLVYGAEKSSITDLDIITNLDNTLGLYIQDKERQASSSNSFMTFLSEFGREYFWSIVIAVLFLFGKREGKIAALVIFVSMIIIIPVNTVLKEIIDRERPLAAFNESSASYPSGHASIVTAGALGSLLYYNNTWKKKIVSILLLMEAFLVCISRIYLESHYVSDVIGGVLLGSFIVLGTSFYVNSIYAFYCSIYNKIRKLF
jgi:membrane-associated phospholipid phosphatase